MTLAQWLSKTFWSRPQIMDVGSFDTLVAALILSVAVGLVVFILYRMLGYRYD